MGKWAKWFLSEEETQEKSYSSFKKFWLNLWEVISFKRFRNRKNGYIPKKVKVS